MLAGREHELQHLTAVLDDARAAVGRVVVLHGEAGVGKSALLREIIAGAADMTVIRTRGVESEAELPYAALHRLLRPALDLVDRLQEPQAESLRRAFGMQSGRSHDRFLISLAVLNLLAELADSGPVLCAVDDAHWLDTASAEALAFAARRLDAEPVAMVFTVRSGLADRLAIDDLPVLRLAPLGVSAAVELLTAEVGAQVHPEAGVRLATAAAGNPLALVELARALSRDQLTGRQPLPAPLPLTSQMESAFLQQVRRLPEATQRLLLVAAADDTGRLSTILSAADALGVDQTALAAAERTGVVRVTGAEVEFRHPLVRSAVYQGATFGERQAVHRALAGVLDERTDPDRRAWHRAAAAVDPDAGIADDLENAAVRADQRGAFAAAAAALERAAELTSDSEVRLRRLAQAAERAWRARQPDRAAALLDRAQSPAMSPSMRAHVDYLRGMAQLAAGMSDAAYRIVREAADGLVTTEPARALELLVFAAEAASNSTDTDSIVSLAELAVRLDAGDAVRERFLTDVLAGTAEHFAGRPTSAVQPLTRALAAAGQLSEPTLLMVAGRAAFYLGDDEAAHRFSAAAVSLGRDAGEVGVVPIAGARAALAEIFAGRWATAEATATEAVGLAEAIGQPGLSGHGLACLAVHAALRGRFEQCQSYADRARALAAGRPMNFIEDWVQWALALRDLTRDEAGPAFGRLREIRHPVVIVFASLDRIESAHRTGDSDLARQWLAELDDAAGASGQPWALARAAHGHALLDDASRADRWFAEALEHHGRAKRPFERARTELDYGAWLRRARRRTAARSHLQAAFDTFDALGAGPWAERTRAELRACGQSVRRRSDTGWDHLTPQETQVAGFVAQGLTNAEVAAKMFLSRRTIDFHLRNVFTKLSITSRTELARIVSQRGGELAAP